MSLFIVMYHYGAWLELDFVNLIFKAYGRYAVSIFYILSGFALFNVYMNRLNTISDVKKFLKKGLKESMLNIKKAILNSQLIHNKNKLHYSC